MSLLLIETLLLSKPTLHQSKPICTDSQHVLGSWVAAPTHTALAREHPPCCLKDGDGFMTTPHHCGTNRTAHSPFADTGETVVASQTWPLAHTGGSACTCRGFVDHFEWHPAHCQVTPFDGESFCAALGARRLLFVGDSTMQQMASVVMQHGQSARLGSVPARLLCLIGAPLAALGSSALPRRGWPAGLPATASKFRASRL